MTTHVYKLGLGDGAYGPGDISEITIEDVGTIQSPPLPIGAIQYLLGRCLNPTNYRGQELRYVVVSPRYVGVTLHDIRDKGGVVAVGRILPGFWEIPPKQFEANQFEYWAVGVLSPLKD